MFRYNLNHLTEWLRDQNLQDSGAADCLLPLTQAVQVFLCKKDEASISNVCTKFNYCSSKKKINSIDFSMKKNYYVIGF